MKKKLYYTIPFVAIPTAMLVGEVLDDLAILPMSPYKIGALLLFLSAIIGFCSPSSETFDLYITVLMPLSLFLFMFIMGFLDQSDLGSRFRLDKALRTAFQPICLTMYCLMTLVTCLSSLNKNLMRCKKSKESKESKEYKISSTLFYVAAALFYLTAIIYFVGGNNTSIGIVWLCCGSTFLCLGTAHSEKSKDNQDNKDEE